MDILTIRQAGWGDSTPYLRKRGDDTGTSQGSEFDAGARSPQSAIASLSARRPICSELESHPRIQKGSGRRSACPVHGGRLQHHQRDFEAGG
jgi:hypothetical protein